MLFNAIRVVAVVLPALLCSACASLNQYSSAEPRFGSRTNLGLIEHEAIREASGIIASRNHANVLWLHNDSGTPAIYAVNTSGRHLGMYLLHGCANGDWEDIAIGPGPDRDYLYIGAIGDNRQVRAARSICRVPEPVVHENQEPVTVDLFDVQVMKVRYPDGSHDAETLMTDPLNDELYIVTKRDNPAGVYRMSFAVTGETAIVPERIAELPFSYLTGGDISPSGTEILIKSYTALYYWRRLPGETLAETLKRAPETAPYTWETGGEAVAWDAQAQGYYTVSEENLGVQARLYYYPRLTAK